jgi:hypothetical protein
MHPRPKRKGSHRYHGPLGREARGEEGVEVLTVDQEPRLKITNLHQDARSPRHAKLERGGHRSSVWNSVLIDASRALAQDGSGPTTEAMVVVETSRG